MLNRTERFMTKKEKKKRRDATVSIYLHFPVNLSALYKNTIHFPLEEHTCYRAVTPNASWLRNTVHITAHKMVYV